MSEKQNLRFFRSEWIIQRHLYPDIFSVISRLQSILTKGIKIK